MQYTTFVSGVSFQGYPRIEIQCRFRIQNRYRQYMKNRTENCCKLLHGCTNQITTTNISYSWLRTFSLGDVPFNSAILLKEYMCILWLFTVNHSWIISRRWLHFNCHSTKNPKLMWPCSDARRTLLNWPIPQSQGNILYRYIQYKGRVV